MLENSIPTLGYLMPSTSSPFVVAVAFMVTIAALLWILAPLATSQPFSLTRKCGIAAAFFVLALSASVTFAGELKYLETMDGAVTPTQRVSSHVEACNLVKAKLPAEWAPTACSPTTNGCTAAVISAGGTCVQNWNIPHKFGTRQTASQASYCSDLKPHWNGVECVDADPCSPSKGKTRSSGFHDYGEDKTKGPRPASCDEKTSCLVIYDGNDISHTATIDGKTHYFAKGKYIYEGSKCEVNSTPAAPNSTPDGAIPPNSCGPGQRLGQVNGRDKCVNVGPPSPPATPGKTASDGPNGTDVPKNPAPPLHDKCWSAFGEVFCYDFIQGIGVVGGNGTEGDPTKDKPMPGDTETPPDGQGDDTKAAPCGAPGQPTCAVKVDETGVSPAVPSGITDAKNAFETAYDSIASKFPEVTAPKQWGITWNYQPPSGACSPLQFGAGKYIASLDICKPLGYVRDLWSYVMYVMTGLYIWRSARDAMNVI